MIRLLYSTLLLLGLPLIFLRLYWRGHALPGYRQHLGERLGRYSRQRPPRQGDAIWLHAVSVGEVRATQSLVAALKREYPARPIVISCMTPTGRATAREIYGDGVVVVYLPYDLPRLQRRFIAHFAPAAVLVMETEIWPNLIAACRAQAVPALLVNARLSEKSRRGYARFAPVRALAGAALRGFHTIAAQSDADAARLIALGASAPVVTGNLKFDSTPDPAMVARGAAWRGRLPPGRRVVLAVSTREGEERLLLEAWNRVLSNETRRGLLLVLVPRHPQRFDAVAALVAEAGFTLQRRSQGETIDPATAVWLGDSMGEVAAYVALSDVAFVGGSLLPLGGQNFIEVSAQAKPAIMGPSTFNFAEAAAQASAAGALFSATDAAAVITLAAELLHTPEKYQTAADAARDFAAAHRGATQKTMGLIAPLLSRQK